MRSILLFFFFYLGYVEADAADDVQCDNILALVSPFVGTGGLAYGYGALSPAAQVPNGPLRLGPDTMDSFLDIDYRHFSGYNFNDNIIRAFSHTRLVGAGISNLGNFGVMPIRHKTVEEDVEKRGWASIFDKSTEVATPGQYNVFLEEPQVQVELLATGLTSAVHKYTWKDSATKVAIKNEAEDFYVPKIVFDVCHAATAAKIQEGLTGDVMCKDANISIDESKQSLEASVLFNEGFWVYMHVEFSGKHESPHSWTICSNGIDEKKLSCARNTTGPSSSTNGKLFAIASLRPKPLDQPFNIEFRIGISFISTELAQQNLMEQAPFEEEFDDLVKRVRNQWCDSLLGVQIEALDGDNELKTMLTTSLYHISTTPTIYTEHGGLYLGLDHIIHNATAERVVAYPQSLAKGSNNKVFEFYSDLSLWDTFRTLHPYILLTDESQAIGILRSISEMTSQQNGFPKWVLASKDISCMIGLHGGTLALEAALSKIGMEKEFDILGIQKALLNQATLPWPVNGRTDLDHYLADGYVSKEATEKSAALTLTYSFDDWVLAELSTIVGDQASAEAGYNRSQNYRKIWSDSNSIMCPRTEEGELICPSSPTGPEAWKDYTEGDALHWSIFVPQDLLGLISLYGSTENFIEKHTMFFDKHLLHTELFGNSLPNPYYWAGNEVNMLAVWMFSYAGNCSLTQRWSRKLTELHFSSQPNGIPGNDDYGAQSSWLLFASLGIYPHAGTTTFILGSPRVKHASLSLSHFDGSKSTLRIETESNSADNVYVAKIFVNGDEWKSPFIDRSVLSAKSGCTITFVMSAAAADAYC